MNGAAIAVTETFRTSKNRSFVVDSTGRILQKTENGGTQHYFYANDKPVGSSGALAAADFDYNYTPVTDQYPALVPGNYVVSAGDTLRGIALAVYGDAQLWYLIADANGLQTDAELTVGRNLTIPNKVTNLRNAYDTYKPYEPGKIIGDLTPTLPEPPPPDDDDGGCGGLGRIIMLAVQIAVSYLIPGPIGAMIGNLAGQVVGNVLGVQDGISWKEVAKAGLSSFIGGQLGAEGSPLAGSDFPTVVARAAVSNALTQGISVAVGLQDKFDWKGVAAAAVGAGVSHAVGNAIGESQYGEERWAEIHDKPNIFGKDFGNTFSRELVTGFASGIAKQVVYGGKANWANIIADAFGNALGNSLAYSATAANSAAQQEQSLDSALADAFKTSGIDWKKGIQVADTGFPTSDAMSPTEEALGNLLSSNSSASPYPACSATITSGCITPEGALQIEIFGSATESATDRIRKAEEAMLELQRAEYNRRWENAQAEAAQAATNQSLISAQETGKTDPATGAIHWPSGAISYPIRTPEIETRVLPLIPTGNSTTTSGGLLVDPATGLPSFAYSSRISRMRTDAATQAAPNTQYAFPHSPSLTVGDHFSPTPAEHPRGYVITRSGVGMLSASAGVVQGLAAIGIGTGLSATPAAPVGWAVNAWGVFHIGKNVADFSLNAANLWKSVTGSGDYFEDSVFEQIVESSGGSQTAKQWAASLSGILCARHIMKPERSMYAKQDEQEESGGRAAAYPERGH